jgi:hypothetical protein
MMVETSEQLTQKRQVTNQFYVAIHTLLIGSSGLLFTYSESAGSIAIATVGLILAYAWQKNIQSYKALNGAKFKVIHELEKHLPAQLFKREYEILKQDNYFELTTVEKIIPFVFGVLYVVVLILGYFV